MALNFKNFFEGLRIKAKAVLTSDTKGELEVDSVTGKLNFHNGTTRSPAVTESHTATLTNKTLTSPVINTPTGITKSDVGLSNVDNTSDATKNAATVTLTNKTLTSPVINSPTGIVKADVGLGNVDNTSDATKNAAVVSLTNHTIDASLNTLSNITNTEIAAAAAIARTKLASGTNNALQANNGSGVLSDIADITLGTNKLTLANTKHLEIQAQTDAATTGSNASLSAFTAGAVRITNASLVSLANIPAGAEGQQFVLFNRTGVSVIIRDSSSAVGTAANRILTGTSLDITMAIDSALVLDYDSVTTRWQIVGGSGGGTTFADNLFQITDDVDSTKAFKFQANTITTGTTRTLTVPNADTTIVGTDVSQTLTNKTLTSPVINTPTGITKSDVGLGNVDNTSDATKNSAIATLTNKSLVDSSTAIVDVGDNTKQIKFDAGGTTGTSTTITAAQTANRVITLPDGTTTLVGVAATQTLTNKTMVVASNTITTAASGNLAATELNSALAELQLDIDTRFKQPNYILNPDAEVNTTGYVTYADAAGVSPVDGTGGAPTTTFTRTTSSPLRGTGSFLITKDAANRQGEGVSYDLTIDASDKGKVLQASFEYQIASGTFADDDISCWIYDITNATIIQPAPYKLKNSTLIEKFTIEFQTLTTSTSYRLIFHVASTSALAYTIKLDNLNLGPQSKLYGSPTTDWVSYTPTLTGFGTTSNLAARYQRIGDNLVVQAYWTNGTTAASIASISLPNGLTIDSTKVSNNNTTAASGAIVGEFQGTTGSQHGSLITATGTSTAFVYYGLNSGTTGLIAKNGNDAMDNATSQSVKFRVPITGWSSSMVLSSDADTRVIAAQLSGQPANVTANNPIIFPTVIKDTHGAYNAATGQYTVQVPGTYNISFTYLAAMIAGGAQKIYKNGVFLATIGTNAQANGYAIGSGEREFITGDIITLVPDISTTSFSAAAGTNNLNIHRVAGPAQIAASESVNARYFASATSISGSLATISWTTKDFDSHNAMSAGTFTVPMSGKYQVNAAIDISGTFALNNTANLQIQKNGTAVSESLIKVGGAETSTPVACSDIISCIAGDTLRVQVLSSATTPTITSSNSKNFISIARVGN